MIQYFVFSKQVGSLIRGKSALKYIETEEGAKGYVNDEIIEVIRDLTKNYDCYHYDITEKDGHIKMECTKNSLEFKITWVITKIEKSIVQWGE